MNAQNMYATRVNEISTKQQKREVLFCISTKTY